ncbi:ribonuclease E/G [Asticcacaulis solisilvae]|uniref:ribonuclease E/G n=1 Tax=Asticcacaulis solisilvae TaxID=1217274 RepID=UPI003FD7CACF
MILYYESRFGLARAALFRDGRAQLYAEGYEADPALTVPGTVSVARLKGRAGGVGFLGLADGGEAVLDAPVEMMHRLADGIAVEIEIAAAARKEKLARARLLRPAEGEDLRRLSPVLDLKARVVAQARHLMGDEDVAQADDGDAIDAAEDEAFNPSGALPGGGYLSIERTRALIACDVDLGDAASGKAAVRRCNDTAVAEAARRLRLSGLAGLVVIDLIGRRHDNEGLRRALENAFAAEARRLMGTPVTKFGTLEFIRPWGWCPAIDLPADLVAAGRLLRTAARQARERPGRILTLRAPADVLDRVRPLIHNSYDPLAPLLRLETGASPEVLS